MKTAVLITGLVLLIVANLVMIYFAPYGLSAAEGFQVANNSANSANSANSNSNNTTNPATNANAVPNTAAANTNSANSMPTNSPGAVPNGAGASEGFQSGGSHYYLENAGGAREQYEPIGAYDGVRLKTGNSSQWRYTAPNEPLMGPAFEPGPDSLFMFKNNQCKPECCGASFSCGGGCVCTTPQQRQYIAERGGNRTAPEDSA